MAVAIKCPQRDVEFVQKKDEWKCPKCEYTVTDRQMQMFKRLADRKDKKRMR